MRLSARWSVCGLVALVLTGCGSDPPANLVFISLDTVRRDHLSVYGYERATTPFLEALAAEGVRFEDAFAQATNTAPSHASMFTGLYPQTHGLIRNGYPMSTTGPTTLAEILGAEGFATAAFVSGYTLESAISGLDRGFEIYDDDFEENARDGSRTLEKAVAWLDSVDPDRRFFLFLHLFDAHGPYRPPTAYADLFRSDSAGDPLRRIARYQRLHDDDGERISTANPYVDRYDALIRYQDDLVARLVDSIDVERTVVVVTADHGETLSERYHSFDHGGRVFDEQIRIPLIVVSPGLDPAVVEGAVETTDLLPTILELLDVEPSAELEIEGRDLSPLIAGRSPGKELVYSTAQATRWRYGDRGYRLDEEQQIKTARTDSWKLIRYPGRTDEIFELYDLKNDPGETDNVADRYPEIRDRLRQDLEIWEQGWATGIEPSRELDPEVEERLRALGYLE